MKKSKNKKVGRPQYVVDLGLLRKLYKDIEKNKITNEQAWNIAKCKKLCGIK